MSSSQNCCGVALLKKLLPSIPSKPGVYKMYDAAGNALYVGKAKDLKQRLTYYAKMHLEYRTTHMVSLIQNLEYIVTNSEINALLLEAQLIKSSQPKFNILLKDDKSFPYIKLRMDHEYPTLVKYRGTDLTDGKYFGPFTSSQQVDIVLDELQKVFQLRSCTDYYFASRKRPCLQYQIKRCSAPCTHKIPRQDYAELVQQVDAVLSNKTVDLQKFLSKQMHQLSELLRFEEAAKIRDKIKAISYVQLKAGVIASGITDSDVITIANIDDYYCISALIYRQGQICDHNTYFPVPMADGDADEILLSFICQFYQSHAMPQEIILNHDFKLRTLCLQVIKQMHGSATQMVFPKRGPRFKLMNDAYHNTLAILKQHIKLSVKHYSMCIEIQQLFNLPLVPERIEIYDNSHLAGTHAIGVMVVSTLYGFDKKEYRTFNIKNNNYGDDYKMLHEVLTRRLKRLAQLTQDANKVPHLMIIDGGGGHQSIVQTVMNELGLNIPYVCMSKGVERNSGRELFHLPNKDLFTLPVNAPVMRYLQILRDEAHNFAIKNHRAKRIKALTSSQVSDIPRIGLRRKKALLNYFGSYKAVCDATVDELMMVPGISKTMAQTIVLALHNTH